MSDTRKTKPRANHNTKACPWCVGNRLHKHERMAPLAVAADASMAWYARETSYLTPCAFGTCNCPVVNLATGEAVPPIAVPAYTPLRVPLLQLARVT